MKKTLILLFAFLITYAVSFTQITKPDIEEMLVEMGTSMETIENLYVWNLKVMDDEGGWYRTRYNYRASFAEGKSTNKYYLLESGIKIVHSQDGEKIEVVYFPFDAMINFILSKESLQVKLKD